MEYADLTRLRSIAFGSFYMDGYSALIANVARYLWMFGTQKLWAASVWLRVPVSEAELQSPVNHDGTSVHLPLLHRNETALDQIDYN
jgi:hypothetical protein